MAPAICAFEPPGWYLHNFGVSNGGPGGIGLINSCPAGKILSIGFARGDLEGNAYVHVLNPLNLATAQIGGTPRNPDNLWTLSGQLICET